MTISEAIAKTVEVNKANGWHDIKTTFAERCMLVVTEISEAVEQDRNASRKEADLLLCDKSSPHQGFKAAFEMYVKDTIPDELADAVIRCFDIAGAEGYDLQKHIELKLKYNAMRGKLHGGKKY